MDGTRPGEPLTDSALDRELESALGIEPSPEFIARVRTRIASDPEPSSWRLADVVSGFSRIGEKWSVEPLAAVAIVGIVLAVVVPQWMRDEQVVKRAPVAVARDVSRPTDVQGPIVRAVEQPARMTLRGVAQTPMDSVHTVPLQLSPVLFAEEDRLAFVSLVAAVGDGRVPKEVVQAPADEDVTALAIQPLVISPLPPIARAAQEGESQWE